MAQRIVERVRSNWAAHEQSWFSLNPPEQHRVREGVSFVPGVIVGFLGALKTFEATSWAPEPLRWVLTFSALALSAGVASGFFNNALYKMGWRQR